MSAKRRDRRIAEDHRWVNQQLAAVDASDRPNLQFELDVLADSQNFRANWVAIATHLRHVPRLAESRGLELGCSVGVKMLLMRRLGAGEMVGCDHAAHLIDDGRHWLGETGVEDIDLVVSDEDCLGFDDASFDWVTLQMVYCQLSDEAIEGLIGEMARVLRRGGLALVHDGANPRHAPTADAMVEYYREVEIGDGDASRPTGPLAVMRRAHIEALHPSLDEATLDDLTQGTTYMRASDVERAVRSYLDSGRTPNSTFEHGSLRPPVALDGQAVRRPTDPFEMRRRFRDAGFDVEFRQSFLGAPVADPEAHYTTDPSVFLVARRR